MAIDLAGCACPWTDQDEEIANINEEIWLALVREEEAIREAERLIKRRKEALRLQHRMLRRRIRQQNAAHSHCRES